MNKLKVKKQMIKEENMDCLEINEEKTEFEFVKDTKITEIKFSKKHIETTWIFQEHSSLQCGCLLHLDHQDIQITIINKENSHLLLQLGIQCSGQNHLLLENILEGNSIQSTIKCRIVGDEKSDTSIVTKGVLKKDTKNNYFLEDVKYIHSEDNQITCNPLLIVDSNDVVANHHFSAGPLNELDLFYLKTKGIEEEKAKELLKESFLKSMILRKEEKNEP